MEKGYLYAGLLAAVISSLWLAAIPTDPKNALLFGYSLLRLAIMALSMAFVLLFAYALRRSSLDSKWHLAFSKGINSCLATPARRWLSLFIAVVGLLSSIIFLVIALNQHDPYLSGILLRVAPWATLAAIISAEVLIFTLRFMQRNARLELAQAKKLDFSKDKLSLTLDDGRKLSLPLSRFPKLHNAKHKGQENYKFIARGLRIHWSDIEEDICVQQFLSGAPQFE